VAQTISPAQRQAALKKVMPDKCASAQSAFEKKRIIIKPSMAPVRELMQLIEFIARGHL